MSKDRRRRSKSGATKDPTVPASVTPEPAALVYEQMTPWAGQVPNAVVAVTEPIGHCLGELAASLGHIAQADVHLATAEATARAFGAPFFMARSLVERARLATTSTNGDDALPRLEGALELAQRHGYSLLERQPLALRTELGVDQRRHHVPPSRLIKP